MSPSRKVGLWEQGGRDLCHEVCTGLGINHVASPPTIKVRSDVLLPFNLVFDPDGIQRTLLRGLLRMA